jgi:hypothetical protein
MSEKFRDYNLPSREDPSQFGIAMESSNQGILARWRFDSVIQWRMNALFVLVFAIRTRGVCRIPGTEPAFLTGFIFLMKGSGKLGREQHDEGYSNQGKEVGRNDKHGRELPVTPIPVTKDSCDHS